MRNSYSESLTYWLMEQYHSLITLSPTHMCSHSLTIYRFSKQFQAVDLFTDSECEISSRGTALLSLSHSPLTHSLTHSLLTHSLSHSLTHPLTLSLSHEYSRYLHSVRRATGQSEYQTMCPLRHHHMEEEVEVSEERERENCLHQPAGRTLCT